jgi:hemerythrin-like domain-containing protein
MNAIQLLTKDHDEVKELFKQFESAGDRANKKKQTISEQVIKELKAHTKIEEQIFYPAVLEKGDKETKALIREGIEEHRIADFMIGRLQSTNPEDETFDAKFKALTDCVKHHIEEEEGQLFPEAKKILRDQLETLGAEMEALEKKLE